MSDVGSLLGRWHQWRRAYSPERGFVTARVMPVENADTEEQLEQLMMLTIERTVEALPRQMQLALQHVARAECMGVEMLVHPDLFDPVNRASLCELALAELRSRLRMQGVL